MSRCGGSGSWSMDRKPVLTSTSRRSGSATEIGEVASVRLRIGNAQLVFESAQIFETPTIADTNRETPPADPLARRVASGAVSDDDGRPDRFVPEFGHSRPRDFGFRCRSTTGHSQRPRHDLRPSVILQRPDSMTTSHTSSDLWCVGSESDGEYWAAIEARSGRSRCRTVRSNRRRSVARRRQLRTRDGRRRPGSGSRLVPGTG